MRRARGMLCASALAVIGCSGDFDLNRNVPPRGSLGRELYSLVCDRVGAQALREDVAAISYHGICHPDPVTGAYTDKVDTSRLVALDPNALDTDGHPVSLDQQLIHRQYRVARVETVGKRREDLVKA